MRKKGPRLELSRSLNQMLGHPDRYDDTTGLTARYTRAMSVPARALDIPQIEMLFGQGPTDDMRALLVPIAVERLATDFFGWHADLLLVVVARHRHVMVEQPEVRRRAVEIVVAHAAALAAYAGLRPGEAVDAALEIVEHDAAALVALERAFAAAGERERVHTAQARRLRAADTAAARVAVLVDIARELEPHDPIEAAYAWLVVLAAAPEHDEASAAAERLFAAYDEWRPVARMLEGRAEVRLARGDLDGALRDLTRAAELAARRPDCAELLEHLRTRIAKLRSA